MFKDLFRKSLVLALCTILIFVIQFFISKFPILTTYAQNVPTDDTGVPDLTGVNSIPDLTGIQQQVDLSITPTNPKPGDEIDASIQSYGIDLNHAQISWYVNGALKASGIGIINFQTTAEALGKPMTILVKISPDTGENPTEKSVTLSAQDVDIIWEASSYTPPFYKGKALYAPEGTVNFVAMPNIINKSGTRVSPANLVYKWSVDNSVVGGQSGYGKNTFKFSGSIIAKDSIVEVEVTAPDGTTGAGIVLLTPQNPKTVFYQNDPLYGIMFNKAITNGYKLKEKEIRIDAYPYFFSVPTKSSSNISYIWKLNDEDIPEATQKNSALFRNTTGQSGTSKISVSVDDAAHILQHSDTAVNVDF